LKTDITPNGMHTPAAEPHGVGRPTEHSALSRVARTTWFPFVASTVVLVGTMLLEAGVHTAVFGAPSYSEALLAPGAHEVWMRFVIAVFVTGIAVIWAVSNRAQADRERRLLEYQSRLRELASQIAHSQHETYGALARRLHEGVAQSLAAGRMFLSADARDDQPVDPTVARSVARILDRAIADCREIATELSPPALETYGLVSALEALAGQVMVRSGVSVEVSADTRPNMPQPLLLASYHAVAEIVSTAAANPQTRTIRLTSEGDATAVTIRVSWDAEDEADLLSTRDRIHIFGGDVHRVVGDGATTVTVVAPLTPAA